MHDTSYKANAKITMIVKISSKLKTGKFKYQCTIIINGMMQNIILFWTVNTFQFYPKN